MISIAYLFEGFLDKDIKNNLLRQPINTEQKDKILNNAIKNYITKTRQMNKTIPIEPK